MLCFLTYHFFFTFSSLISSLTYFFPLRIDPLRFQAGCRKRRLNLASVFLCLFCVVVHFFWLANACFCCVSFSFSVPNEELDLGNVSEMTYFCRVGRKTTTQSISQWTNMTSCRKPEVHNVSQHDYRLYGHTTATCSMHRKTGEARMHGFWDKRADRQTYILYTVVHYFALLRGRGELVNKITCWWLGSREVSVLDSGAEGPWFKSQSRRCRVTVLGKLFAPIVPLFTKQQNW